MELGFEKIRNNIVIYQLKMSSLFINLLFISIEREKEGLRRIFCKKPMLKRIRGISTLFSVHQNDKNEVLLNDAQLIFFEGEREREKKHWLNRGCFVCSLLHFFYALLLLLISTLMFVVYILIVGVIVKSSLSSYSQEENQRTWY